MAHKSFRKPAETGPYVYYARDEEGRTFQVKGEDAKFDFGEATLIDKGFEPEAILARRAKLARPVETSAEADTVKRGPGRPPKG